MNIGILAYRGVMLSAVYGIEEMLHIAGDRYGVPIDGVVRVAPEALPAAPFHLLILPPSIERDPPASTATLTAWLISQHKKGCVLASACAGIFLLAPTGVLDGRTATTHWLLAGSAARNNFQPLPFNRSDYWLMRGMSLPPAAYPPGWI